MGKFDELLSFDVAALSNKLRAKEISPVEVTNAYLDRIDKFDEKLLAYITVTPQVAREAAHKAESEIAGGHWRGPFHGVPVALKDLCYTKGILTTGGSKILGEFVPDFDCTVWARLRDAGAVLLGKLNLHEFASGATNTNPHWGRAEIRTTSNACRVARAAGRRWQSSRGWRQRQSAPIPAARFGSRRRFADASGSSRRGAA